MSEVLRRLSAALTDRYRVDREVGAGGMATVYLAHDLRHERDVAIKVLHPDLGAALGADRFLAEIKTTARLQHPHILPLLDSGAADGLLYYVMPYVRGETLRARLERERQLPVPDALRIAREVAGALEHAHKQGIIHRDIKPENILLQDGSALVADFGIALAVQSAGTQRLTQTGLSLGTPQYMSPEQAMGEKTIDARSDVYALGAVAYEMLAGEPPFSGESVQSIVARVLTERPTSLVVLRDTVPPAIDAVIGTALAKRPADRQESAAVLSDQLAGALASVAPITGLTAGAAATVVRRSTSGPRRWWIGLAAALLLIPAGAFLGRLLSPVPDTPVQRLTIPTQRLSGLPNQADNLRLALSPDARLLAYVDRAPEGSASGGAGYDVWIRPLDSTAARPLSVTTDPVAPTFSPDGKFIAFIGGSPRAVRVVPVAGGDARVLTDSLVDDGGIAWSEDGYLYYDGHLAGDGIARVSEKGGAPEVATVPNAERGELWHFAPSALPGGKAILFTAPRENLADQDIVWMPLPRGTPKVVTRGVSPRYLDGHLLWVNGAGALQAASFDAATGTLTGEPFTIETGLAVHRIGLSNLAVAPTGLVAFLRGGQDAVDESFYVIDRNGRELPVDTTLRGKFIGFSVSPDGTKIAYGLASPNSTQIWIKTIGGGPPVRFSFEPEFCLFPSWSADGATLAYFSVNSDSTRRMAVYVGDAMQRTPPALWRRALGDDGYLQHHAKSDVVLTTTNRRIMAAALRGDTTEHQLLPGKRGTLEMSPRISPDGRWIAYTSNESGRLEVFVRSFPDVLRTRLQVSIAGGFEPTWSSDGTQLFYGDEHNVLRSAHLLFGESVRVTERETLFSLDPYRGSLRQTYEPLPDRQHFVVARAPRGAQGAQIGVITGAISLLRHRGGRAP